MWSGLRCPIHGIEREHLRTEVDAPMPAKGQVSYCCFSAAGQGSCNCPTERVPKGHTAAKQAELLCFDRVPDVVGVLPRKRGDSILKAAAKATSDERGETGGILDSPRLRLLNELLLAQKKELPGLELAIVAPYTRLVEVTFERAPESARTFRSLRSIVRRLVRSNICTPGLSSNSIPQKTVIKRLGYHRWRIAQH